MRLGSAGERAAADLAFVLAFAFGAGMVAFFSPCCAALLPAYVSFALGKSESIGGKAPARPASRASREIGAIAVWVGLIVAALGLGRLALESLSNFGGPAPPSATGDRELSVLLAAGGVALTLVGYFACADRPRLKAALLFGGLATLGFLVTFLAIGAPVALSAAAVGPYLRWAAVGVGLVLIVLGGFAILRGHLPFSIPSFSPRGSGARSFFLFGVAYGLASLSCTFPIFLVVVLLAVASGGLATALAAFAAYALGKGTLMTLVTVLSMASPAAVEGRLKKILPKFDLAMYVVILLAGAFVVYYFGVLYAPA